MLCSESCTARAGMKILWSNSKNKPSWKHAPTPPPKKNLKCKNPSNNTLPPFLARIRCVLSLYLLYFNSITNSCVFILMASYSRKSHAYNITIRWVKVFYNPSSTYQYWTFLHYMSHKRIFFESPIHHWRRVVFLFPGFTRKDQSDSASRVGCTFHNINY